MRMARQKSVTRSISQPVGSQDCHLHPPLSLRKEVITTMVKPLTLKQLRRSCDLASFDFQTTEEIRPDARIIGQPRGIHAIEFGLDVESPGYNIYVLGESGTGRTTAIRNFIKARAENEPVPSDWAYVYNFREPHKPIALQLEPGMGCKFRDDMSQLIEDLKAGIPRAFDSDAFRDAIQGIQEELSKKREREFSALQAQAAQKGAAVIAAPDGARIVPVRNGQALSAQEFAALTNEEKEAWRQIAKSLETALADTARQSQKDERAAQQEIETLIRRVAASVVDERLDTLQGRYQDHEEILNYLDQVQQDILDHVELFRPENEDGDARKELPGMDPFRRYKVNVIVDQRLAEGAPVVVENDPKLMRLLGRVEHESRFPAGVFTDFTLIRGGCLHEANGGYLVLRAKDLFSEPGSWDGLKRALVGECVSPDDPAARGGAPTRSLDPEPIPLDLKIILVGPPDVYYLVHAVDEDFRTLFKVLADFDELMDRNKTNENEYANFVATRCSEEGLRHFDREAVGQLVELGSRLAGSQKKLTTRFGDIADIVREANYWAGKAGRDLVTAQDVLQAIVEREYRQNRIQTRRREQVLDGKILIATEGAALGQINGLSVAAVGDHQFGHASRVTARTFVGKEGVVQIDREVQLAGPIHNKGVMTLVGYLGGQYAHELPLSLSAQITFEQNYGGIEGDSASSTELYALLSSLSGIPIKQSIGVTGSVNQHGGIQAIGGVTYKVEGWYEICKKRGLTGDQGVLLPAANIPDLMLREVVLRSVEEGAFHLWAVSTVDEGLEILMERPASEVHQAVQQRLSQLAETIRKFSGRE